MSNQTTSHSIQAYVGDAIDLLNASRDSLEFWNHHKQAAELQALLNELYREVEVN